jgi:hypothetical protein
MDQRKDLSIDRNALVEAANELEILAIDLGEKDVEATKAISSLLGAADGNLAAVRRAHRHCQRRVSELWPAEGPLIRSFFYLGAVRRQMKVKERRPT